MEDQQLQACDLPRAGAPDAAPPVVAVPPAAPGPALDLSSDEDLGVGIMNLISIEEHLFFTASKTGNARYLELLLEIRDIRKELLQKIVVSFEGEVWCISKHLLAASMRLMEVGTKELKVNGIVASQPYFATSYRLFRMFWALVLGQPAPAEAPAGAPEQAPAPPGAPPKLEVVFYFEPTCPHCRAVEAFLARNRLQDLFQITRKDVTSDPANRAELEAVHASCLQDGGTLVVPAVSLAGKCAMGEEGVIRLFKSLMWDNVATLRQSVASLVDQGRVPAQVKTHLEHFNQAVDAALNCCKE